MILLQIYPSQGSDAGEIGCMADHLLTLYREGPDAIVLANDAGVIEAANEAFLNMSNVAHEFNLQGRSLADFLVRGQVDLAVLLDNARRDGVMRLYATRLIAAFDASLPIEVAATWLTDGPEPRVAFVIRDMGRADMMRKAAVPSDRAVRPDAVDRVGSASLREIVAETTDVVEKLCIEAAVRLTNNNRVAAAEMLGLSRQSLYVKLRKYDLLARNKQDL